VSVATNLARLACLSSTALLGGCALFSSQIEVSRRYQLATVGELNTQCADKAGSTSWCYEASVSAVPVPDAAGGVAATALSDRGQGAYLTALGAKAANLAELKAALATPAKSGGGASPLYEDATSRELRFVLGIFPSNGFLLPADRLTWAKVTIEPRVGTTRDGKTFDYKPARFVAWTMAANHDEVIDVGSVTATRSDKFTADTGIGIGKPLSDTKAGLELSATREEKADIKDRSSINAAVVDGSAIIVQAAGWRRDLSGNATFDATLALPPEAGSTVVFTSFSDINGPPADGVPTWTPAAKMRLAFPQTRLPFNSPICVRVTLDFVVRRTNAGDRTFTESDDYVSFLRGRTTRISHIALPAQQIWMIVAPVKNLRLQANTETDTQVLKFRSRDEALQFLSWLRAVNPAGGKIGNARLHFGDEQPLDITHYEGVDAVYAEAIADWKSADAPCPRTVFDSP
jgi:hypothetical protein